MGHSFPNPIPNGTAVPQWALRDVTVSFYLPSLTCAHRTRKHDDFGLWSDLLAKTIGGRNPPLSLFFRPLIPMFSRQSRDRSRCVDQRIKLLYH